MESCPSFADFVVMRITPAAARSVDGGRSSILEDCDLLDIIAGNVVNAAHGHSIHEYERRRAVDACHSTNLERRAGSRHRTGPCHLKTGDGTLKTLRELSRTLLLDELAVQHTYRTCEILLPDRSIADDHGFLKLERIVLKNDVQSGLSLVADSKVHVAHTGDFKILAFLRTFELKRSGRVGHSPFAIVLVKNHGTCDSLPVLVCYDTFDIGLGKSRKADRHRT